MHILLEEVPLLVFYFLTLFLSNYKLRLILSIFWTTSTFCQLELPCSLCSLRSLDAHLLTHFVCSLRSLITHSLRSFAQRSLHSLTSFVCYARSLLTHFVRSLNARFARLLHIVPSISLATCEFAFRFTLYNSRSRAVLFRNSFHFLDGYFSVMTEILISRKLTFLTECRAITESPVKIAVKNNIKCELRATQVVRPKTCNFPIG